MKAKEQTQYSISYLIKELVFDIVRFPAWWYSRGLANIAGFWLREIRSILDHLSLRIWVRNLFTPMYGDYTKSGRIISFFLRIIVLIWRFIEFVIGSIFFSCLVVIWILLPVVITYAIIQQFR
jgi:hypothetical protein